MASKRRHQCGVRVMDSGEGPRQKSGIAAAERREKRGVTAALRQRLEQLPVRVPLGPTFLRWKLARIPSPYFTDR